MMVLTFHRLISISFMLTAEIKGSRAGAMDRMKDLALILMTQMPGMSGISTAGSGEDIPGKSAEAAVIRT